VQRAKPECERGCTGCGGGRCRQMQQMEGPDQQEVDAYHLANNGEAVDPGRAQAHTRICRVTNSNIASRVFDLVSSFSGRDNITKVRARRGSCCDKFKVWASRTRPALCRFRQPGYTQRLSAKGLMIACPKFPECEPCGTQSRCDWNGGIADRLWKFLVNYAISTASMPV